MKSTVLPVLFGISVLLSTCFGHGYVHQSRSHLCHRSIGQNTNCGRAIDEPQSIEGLKGFPLAGPRDGYIASANLTEFHDMDDFGARRWTLTPISTYVTGEKDGKLTLEFPWNITALHMTTSFEYFISKPTFDPTTPLSRAQLDLTPFCVDNSFLGHLPLTQRGVYVSRNCTLDATDYSGHHVILAVWVLHNTETAHYQVIDVQFADRSILSSDAVSSSSAESSSETISSVKAIRELEPICNWNAESSSSAVSSSEAVSSSNAKSSSETVRSAQESGSV